jgi:hypothetical protein
MLTIGVLASTSRYLCPCASLDTCITLYVTVHACYKTEYTHHHPPTMQLTVDRFFSASVGLTKLLFMVTLMLGCAGFVVLLGGVASMQNFCQNTPAYFQSVFLPW